MKPSVTYDMHPEEAYTCGLDDAIALLRECITWDGQVVGDPVSKIMEHRRDFMDGLFD